MADATTTNPDRLRALPALHARWTRVWEGFPQLHAPLIGREGEVAELAGLLRQAESRLITLTGPGGVGKTRLAIAAATACADAFPDGAAFIPLAAIQDPSLLVSAIARALDVRESTQRPLAETVAAALRDRRLLLVLDNFEHIMAAASDVASLLAACPLLSVLVTSRVRLRLSPEQRFVTPPLALPEAGASAPINALAGHDAIALFVERARWVQPGFALTEQNADAMLAICQRLDGLPLAIELAAAWMRVLSPEMLLERLHTRLPLLQGGAEDQPDRLRTMRDAIAWSYGLLTPEEARLFRRLSVFVGGFTLDAAEAIGSQQGEAWSSDPSPTSILDLLASLIDKSLLQLQMDGPDSRFLILETVREFGLEQLAGAGEEAATRQAHAVCFQAFAEDAEIPIADLARREDLDRIEADLPNLRAAFTWFIDTSQTECALRLASALIDFASLTDHKRENSAWLERGLALAPDAPLSLRAKTLSGIGLNACFLFDLERSDAALAEAERLARRDGNQRVLARVFVGQGHLAIYRGQFARAAERGSAAATLAEPIGDHGKALLGRLLTARATYDLGDLNRAEALHHEVLAAAAALGRPHIVAMTHQGLAFRFLARGEIKRSAAELTAALRSFREVGDVWQVANCIGGIAIAATRTGQDADAAARLYGAVTTLYEATGMPLPPIERQSAERAVATMKSALGESAFDAARIAGRRLSLDDAVAEAVALATRLTGRNESAVSAAPVAAPWRTDGTPEKVSRKSPLSPRQREVLALMVAGYSDQQIADMLFISRRTASHHVSAIMTKLNVRSRGEAAVYGIRAGLI